MSNQRLTVFFFSFLRRRRRRRNSCQKAVMKKKNVGWEKKAWNSVAYTRSGPAQSYLLILPWYLVLVNLYEGELYFRPFFSAGILRLQAAPPLKWLFPTNNSPLTIEDLSSEETGNRYFFSSSSSSKTDRENVLKNRWWWADGYLSTHIWFSKRC